MDTIIYFLIIICIVASKTSMYIFIKFLNLKKKRQIRNSLIGFIIMIFLTGIFMGLTLILLLINNPYVYLVKIIVWFVSIQSLYFLNKYSLLMMNLEFDVKYSFKKNWPFQIIPLFIALPWNYWNYMSYYDLNIFSLQPISLGLIIILSIIVFTRSYKRCIIAQKKILDPSLNELYSWIHKGIIGISMTCVLLFSMVLRYLAPPSLSGFIEFFSMISFVIGGCGVIYCVICFYLAFKTPKSLMKSFYKKHRPMWKEKN